MIVQAGDAVVLHLNLKLKDGSVAESTRAVNKPAKFQLGDGSLTAAIENQLIGLAVGESKQFAVTAQDGFGERKPALIQYLQRYEFPSDIELGVGMIIGFSHPSGSEMPGVVRDIAGDSITVDFNHPLAGEELHFDIEVLDIVRLSVGTRTVSEQIQSTH
jgi:FKBP-type peptidyl-prolyl cis-trans isomerase SlpA